jgi:hypothetical protein
MGPADLLESEIAAEFGKYRVTYLETITSFYSGADSQIEEFLKTQDFSYFCNPDFVERESQQLKLETQIQISEFEGEIEDILEGCEDSQSSNSSAKNEPLTVSYNSNLIYMAA